MKRLLLFRIVRLVLLTTGFISTIISIAGNSTQPASIDPRMRNKLNSTSGELTMNKTEGLSAGNGLYFTPNKGQIADMNGKLCPDILYKGEGGGIDIYLRKTGMSYVSNNMDEVINGINKQIEKLIRDETITEADEQKKKDELTRNSEIKGHRLDIDFSGCNSNIQTRSENRLSGIVNYYYPHCSEGVTGVIQYAKVTYFNVYDNIDIVCYGEEEASTSFKAKHGLKYDIVVNPGGNPDEIQLKYSGADKILLRDGILKVSTDLGDMEEWVPKVYQRINERVIDVHAEYILNKISNQSTLVTFKLSNYNRNYSLVIDPWITYYGGNGDDAPYSICNDNNGNVVTVGTTSSSNFPVSSGAFQMLNNGSYDVFVVSLQPNGTVRNFATYYGGSNADYGNGIHCDAFDNVVVGGNTFSASFPTGSVGPNVVYQSSGGTGFIFKLSSTGSRHFATCINGEVMDVAADIANNIIAVGKTVSTTGISTGGSYQPSKALGQDAFVMKFQPTGAFIWGTFFGGSSFDSALGVDTDSTTDDICFTGTTVSSIFPVLSGHQMSYGGGGMDGFIAKINSSGTTLLWSTFYGGTGWDEGHAIVIDYLGNVIMGGSTKSSAGIATAGAAQTIFGGGTADAMIVKFNSGGVRQWGAYMGGNDNDYCNGIACDGFGNIIAAGDTYSNNLATTSCAFQPNFIGTEDQFVATYSFWGIKICLSYLGKGTVNSPNNETTLAGGCVSVFGCQLYLCAFSQCTYPVTIGAYQTTCGGGDACIAQLDINSCGLPVAPLVTVNTVSSNCTCNGAVTLGLTAGCKLPPFSYTYSNGSQTLGTTALNNTVNNLCAGTFQYTVTTACDTVKGNFTITGAASNLMVNSIIQNASCLSPTGSVTITSVTNGVPNYKIVEGVTTIATNANTPYTISGIAVGTHTYVITDANGCAANTTITITAPPPLIGQFAIGTANCNNCGCKEWIMINATGGEAPYSYTWPDGYSNRYKNQLCPGAYTIDVKDKNNCSVSISVTAP